MKATDNELFYKTFLLHTFYVQGPTLGSRESIEINRLRNQ